MPPTTVGVSPEMSATTRMASTRRRVSSPTSRTCGVPALPDTSPPFGRIPGVEDLAAAADVLREVECDEQGRGERSFLKGPSRGVDPALADLGNRRHSHGRADLPRGGGDAQERAGAPTSPPTTSSQRTRSSGAPYTAAASVSVNAQPTVPSTSAKPSWSASLAGPLPGSGAPARLTRLPDHTSATLQNSSDVGRLVAPSTRESSLSALRTSDTVLGERR